MRRSASLAARLRTVCLIITPVLLSTTPSAGIPMWSRRYTVPCSTCHAYPSLQLTAMGLDFFRRGHRMQGDSLDKDLTHLLSAHIEWEYEARQRESTAFESPEFHLHAGGAFSPMFSGYVDANVNEDFETMYLQFTKEKGESLYFTARAGKLIPTIIRSYGNGLMASASTPLVLTEVTLGNNPFAPARDSFGVTLAGRWKTLFGEAGVVNGEDVEGVAVVNNHKDVYATAEMAISGGTSGAGLYYFRGGYDLGDPSTSLRFDRYDRKGVFGNFTRDHFRVAGAYLYGGDRIDALARNKIHGYFAQVDLHPAAPWVPFARFDSVRTQVPEGSHVLKETVGCALRVYESEMTAGRVVFELSREKEDGAHTNGVLFNFLWAM